MYFKFSWCFQSVWKTKSTAAMISICATLLSAAIAIAEPINEQKKIGSLSTLKHAVNGDLYALDEKTLMVKNFNYDGAGPDAFFWVGTEGSPDSPINIDKTAILAHPYQGQHYSYNDSAPVLKASSQETLTLVLPPNLRVSDLKWFSVWCRLFGVDFGNLMIPADFEAPGAIPEPEPETIPEPVPKTIPTRKEELPSPVITNNAVDEPKPEPETVPESIPDSGYNHEDDHSPNSLESKSEPEAEPGSAPHMVSGLVSIFTVVTLASLLH